MLMNMELQSVRSSFAKCALRLCPGNAASAALVLGSVPPHVKRRG